MTGTTPKEERDKRRGIVRVELLRLGYSTATAGALAKIDDPNAREAIRDTIGRVGVGDGIPRVYLIRLIAHDLGVADYPAPPAKLTAAELRHIQDAAVSAVGYIRGASAA